MKMRFTQKVMLVVIVVVLIGFGGYAVVSDHVQHRATNDNLQHTVDQVAEVAAQSIQGWITARVQLLRMTAQAIEVNPTPAVIATAISRPVMVETFGMTYVGWQTVLNLSIVQPRKCLMAMTIVRVLGISRRSLPRALFFPSHT